MKLLRNFICLFWIPCFAMAEPSRPAGRVTLSWEMSSQSHPERAVWSDALLKQIDIRFSVLNKAKDIALFCPNYARLEFASQEKVWAELMVADAYYESGDDPHSSSVDVGINSDRDTWSVGLWQVSVNDQQWAFGENKKSYRYSYNDLLIPGPNADLAVAELAFQIENRRLIVVCGKPIFATLFRGKSDEISEISASVEKNVSGC